MYKSWLRMELRLDLKCLKLKIIDYLPLAIQQNLEIFKIQKKIKYYVQLTYGVKQQKFS
jgi:hypothetical protein